MDYLQALNVTRQDSKLDKLLSELNTSNRVDEKNFINSLSTTCFERLFNTIEQDIFVEIREACVDFINSSNTQLTRTLARTLLQQVISDIKYTDIPVHKENLVYIREQKKDQERRYRKLPPPKPAAIRNDIGRGCPPRDKGFFEEAYPPVQRAVTREVNTIQEELNLLKAQLEQKEREIKFNERVVKEREIIVRQQEESNIKLRGELEAQRNLMLESQYNLQRADAELSIRIADIERRERSFQAHVEELQYNQNIEADNLTKLITSLKNTYDRGVVEVEKQMTAISDLNLTVSRLNIEINNLEEKKQLGILEYNNTLDRIKKIKEEGDQAYTFINTQISELRKKVSILDIQYNNGRTEVALLDDQYRSLLSELAGLDIKQGPVYAEDVDASTDGEPVYAEDL